MDLSFDQLLPHCMKRLCYCTRVSFPLIYGYRNLNKLNFSLPATVTRTRSQKKFSPAGGTSYQETWAGGAPCPAPSRSL